MKSTNQNLEKVIVNIGNPLFLLVLINFIFVIGKYHKGKFVKGQSVFGGVELLSMSLGNVPVPDISAEILMKIIKNWISPGSIIISDCRKSNNLH